MIPLGIIVLYYLFVNYTLEALFVLIFPIVFGIVAISILVKAQGIIEYIFGFAFFIGGLVPLLGFEKDIFFSPVALFLFMLYVITFIYFHIGIYTKKGAEYKWQLLGLKEFIKRVKKEEIKYFLQEDPLFLDKLLPYAMLFGLSKHWLQNYIYYNIEPTWIEGGNIYLLESFDSDLDSLSTIQSENEDNFGLEVGGGSLGGGGGEW